jgi:pimeloyl-ACP methyl ester carboxylesterase
VHTADGRILPVDQADFGPAVVVLVHGLDDPGTAWKALLPILRTTDATACEFTYPNDGPIPNAAQRLAAGLKELRARGVRRVSIVTHSMGGLVAREMLTHPELYAGQDSSESLYPRVDRLIMVGPPNHGSPLARFRWAAELREQVIRALSGDGLLFGSSFDGAGQAGVDLLPDSPFLTALNARPLPEGVTITIIAGDLSPVSAEAISRITSQLTTRSAEELGQDVERIGTALNNVARGLGDGVVSLESTRLEGVTDHVVVPANHLTMIRNITTRSDRVPPAIPIILDRLQLTPAAPPGSRPAPP